MITMKKTQQKQIICMGLLFLILLLFFSAVQFGPSKIKISASQNSPISPFLGTEIKNVTYTPERPEWYDNITINAQITDPWGILEAKINYKADNDAYAGWGANFTMPNVADDWYRYFILNSIWNSPWGPAFGSYVNFTIYAKNGLGKWSKSGYYQFYVNDTVQPAIQIGLNNNSWVSHLIKINITTIESGSGLERMNLSIFMGNGTLYKRFTSTILNKTFDWDVSQLPNYNISKPSSYFTLNLTVWDKAKNKNTIFVQNVRVDNTPPSIAFINSTKTLTTTCMDNRTITNNAISATNFINNYTKTYLNDAKYHSFTNQSKGFLQVVYGLNLTQWNVTTAILKNLYITFEAKIAYANISVLQAGWKIWNWVSKDFTIIDSRIFNSTTDVSDTLLISSMNKSLLINSAFNNRIEIFFFVNTSGPIIRASVDFIQYNLSYYKIDEWYNRDNQNITLDIIGSDKLSFDRIELFHANITFYIWTTSGEHFLSFNTTLLPDGLVPLNITVYDKAGNSNSSSIRLNVKYFGPEISIISPVNNSYLGQSKIWDLIIPVQLSGHDGSNAFRKMELYIDGQLTPVRDGQLGQIREYDAYGNVIYKQKNATWYKEGTYTYYWNASLLAHNSKHELLIRSFDRFLNPRETRNLVTMASFKTNVSIINTRTNYTTTSGVAILLEFRITNYGNSTLKDFKPRIIIPSNWEYTFKDLSDFDFNYLNPGATFLLKVQIIPKDVQATINQSIGIILSCKTIENLTQTINNFTIQIHTYLVVGPPSVNDRSIAAILIIVSILAGFALGLLSFYIYQYLKNASIQASKAPEKEKPKKEKAK